MKTLVLLFGVITFLVLSTGCDTSETLPTDVNFDDHPTIELRVTHDRIIGSQGDLKSVQITAIVRNADGLTVPGTIIQFSIRDPEDWKGTIAVAEGDSVTDQNGEVTAIYSVVLERSGDVVIEARCGSVSSTLIIRLALVIDLIGRFSIDAFAILAVPPDQTIQTPITATLIDTSGNAVSDVLIHFRVGTPALGYFDSDTGMTDVNGEAVRTFNTIANQYGICMIHAQFGSTEVSASIWIAPPGSLRSITLLTEPRDSLLVYPNQNVQVEIMALGKDINNRLIPVDVYFEIIPYLPSGDIFGTLYPVVGERTTFSSLGGYGKLVIRASCLDHFENVIEAFILLDFRLIPDQIDDLILSVEPDSLFLHRDSVGVADITVRVVDIDDNGLENVLVDFSSMYGALWRYGDVWRVTPTDSDGYASAEYRICPQTDFPGDETEIVDTITAVIRGTDIEAQAQIYVRVTN